MVHVRKIVLGAYRRATGVLCVTLLAVLVHKMSALVVLAHPPYEGIHVTILNIENSRGNLACALFESPEGFPHEFLRSAKKIMVMKILDNKARCDFLSISPGTYAIAVIHDENMNGKLNTNWLGIPIEGYGFSNEAKGLIGAPSFSAASFPYDGQILYMTINLRY